MTCTNCKCSWNIEPVMNADGEPFCSRDCMEDYEQSNHTASGTPPHGLDEEPELSPI